MLSFIIFLFILLSAFILITSLESKYPRFKYWFNRHPAHPRWRHFISHAFTVLIIFFFLLSCFFAFRDNDILSAFWALVFAIVLADRLVNPFSGHGPR